MAGNGTTGWSGSSRCSLIWICWICWWSVPGEGLPTGSPTFDSWDWSELLEGQGQDPLIFDRERSRSRSRDSAPAGPPFETGLRCERNPHYAVSEIQAWFSGSLVHGNRNGGSLCLCLCSSPSYPGKGGRVEGWSFGSCRFRAPMFRRNRCVLYRLFRWERSVRQERSVCGTPAPVG